LTGELPAEPEETPTPIPAGTGAPFDHQLKVLYATAFDGLFIVDDERHYLRINEPATELLGAPEDRILKLRIEDFTPPELLPTLEQLWAQLERDGTLHGPYEVLRGDGARSFVEYQATWNFGCGQHLIAARAIDPDWSKGAGLAATEDGPQLTAREHEVLQLASDGKSTRQIAEALFLSPGTVKTHFRNIYEKFGARDRANAVAECLRRGLID
jgi:DNA-binding CsgD family transcriptional regulator